MAGFQKGEPGAGTTNEDHITPFAKAVKAANASTRVLYYQNTLINFPQTRLGRHVNASVPTSLLLHDKRGRLVYLGGCGSTHAAPNHTIFDHSKAAMRGLWTQNIVDVVKENKVGVWGVWGGKAFEHWNVVCVCVCVCVYVCVCVCVCVLCVM